MLLQQLRENRIFLAPHSHKSFHLMHQIFPNAKMRSRFMIPCQLSLNGFPFIFPPPLLYKPLSPSFQDKKNPPLFSSLLLSSSEVEQSCHILVFLRLKVLSETHSPSPSSSFPPPLGPPSRISSSITWILHEGIIHFLYLFFVLP